jgi:hypothetical protein
MSRRKRYRYSSPDGLDWRNPQMPVFARWVTSDNRIESGYVDPSIMEAVCQHGMRIPGYPRWDKDPTYNMRRRK